MNKVINSAKKELVAEKKLFGNANASFLWQDDILTKISSCKHQSNKKLQTELIWDGPRGDNWVPPIAKKVRKIRLFGDYIRLK